MSADQLARAAQAVLERWNSPRWEWSQLGPTAGLMEALQAALAAHRAQAGEAAHPTMQELAAGAHYPQVTAWENPAPNAAAPFTPSPTTKIVLGASPHQVAQQWIAVGERMPDPGINVLACFRYGGTGRAQVVRAMHAPQFTCSEEQFGEFLGEGGEYDEKTDATYWPEGWYESNEAEETSWRLHEEVTHWMPLPAAPTKEQSGK